MTPPPVQALLLDLDGLLLDTETLCVQVAREVVARHGKALTLDAQRAALGKRPLECWADVVQILGLEASPQQLLDESEPLMAARWADAPLMPGALRLVRHLAARGVPFAVATSTPRATFNAKMAAKAELRALLGGDGAAAPVAVVCGDEVERGKPHPDVFLAAASRLGVAPEQCLVLEDAPSGAQGATAAGMRVVVVPSLLDASAYDPPEPAARQGVVEHLPSLLAFRPQRYGLPAFGDRLGAAAAGQGPAGEAQGQAQGGGGGGGPAGAEAEEDGVIPMDRVIRIKGKVVKGFGRGSKELGIPTANVDPAAVHAALADAVTGIYAGWARLGSGPEVYKTVMSIGYNPFFANKEKTLEPWILHTFEQPFYGEELRLVVVGYVRPEANFASLEALVARIHADADVSRRALELEPLAGFAQDAFLLASD